MKINPTIIYFSIILLLSCTKSTEQTEQFEQKIVANWKAIQYVYEPGLFNNMPTGHKYFMNFSENGNFSGNTFFSNSVNDCDKYKIDDSAHITFYKQFTTDSAKIYYVFENFNKELIVSFYGCREPCRLKLIRN